MEFNTISGALRNCRYHGPKRVYVLRTPKGKYICAASSLEMEIGEDYREYPPGFTIVSFH